MTNKELLELMNRNLDEISKELTSMRSDIKTLISYKDSSQGSLTTFKYLVGIGFAGMSILIGLIGMYLSK